MLWRPHPQASPSSLKTERQGQRCPCLVVSALTPLEAVSGSEGAVTQATPGPGHHAARQPDTSREPGQASVFLSPEDVTLGR